jgi:hypothetical protein
MRSGGVAVLMLATIASPLAAPTPQVQENLPISSLNILAQSSFDRDSERRNLQDPVVITVQLIKTMNAALKQLDAKQLNDLGEAILPKLAEAALDLKRPEVQRELALNVIASSTHSSARLALRVVVDSLAKQLTTIEPLGKRASLPYRIAEPLGIAVTALARHGDERDIGPIELVTQRYIDLVKHPRLGQEGARIGIEALANFDSEVAAEALHSISINPQNPPELRIQALAGLALYTDERWNCGGILCDLLKDSALRKNAVIWGRHSSLVYDSCSAENESALLSIAQESGSSPELRKQVLATLASIGSLRSLPHLLSALQDDNLPMKDRESLAYWSIGNLNLGEAPALLFSILSSNSYPLSVRAIAGASYAERHVQHSPSLAPVFVDRLLDLAKEGPIGLLTPSNCLLSALRIARSYASVSAAKDAKAEAGLCSVEKLSIRMFTDSDFHDSSKLDFIRALRFEDFSGIAGYKKHIEQLDSLTNSEELKISLAEVAQDETANQVAVYNDQELPTRSLRVGQMIAQVKGSPSVIQDIIQDLGNRSRSRARLSPLEVKQVQQAVEYLCCSSHPSAQQAILEARINAAPSLSYVITKAQQGAWDQPQIRTIMEQSFAALGASTDDRYSVQLKEAAAAIAPALALGINNPLRIPPQALATIVKERVEPVQDGSRRVLVLAAQQDEVFAFPSFGPQIQQMLEKGYRVSYHEVADKNAFATALAQYSQNQADLLVVVAHGEKSGIMLGAGELISSDDSLIKPYNMALKPGGQIILCSCSTGNGELRALESDNMATMFRRAFPHAAEKGIIAPVAPALGSKLEIHFDLKGQVQKVLWHARSVFAAAPSQRGEGSIIA